MTTPITPSCRVCYSYNRPGFIQPCCPPIVTATNQTLSSISSSLSVINNSANLTEGTLLLSMQQALQKCTQSTIQSTIIQSTILNAAAINSSLYAELLEIQKQRYVPFQPYVYPLLPSSVVKLQMDSMNVGNPMPPTITCIGDKFVTN
jgi:hypothetical protein